MQLHSWFFTIILFLFTTQSCFWLEEKVHSVALFFFFFFKHQFVFASLDVVCYIKLFIFTEWKLIIVYEIPNTYGHSVG